MFPANSCKKPIYSFKKGVLFYTTLFLLGLHNSNSFAQQKWLITAPAGSEYTKIDKNGKTVIPNGRIITPRGKQITIAPHPYGLILSPDGNTIVTANSGINPFSITIIRNILSENPEVQQIPPGARTDNGILEACFMGLAVSPDNATVYVSGGETNKIFLFDLKTGKAKGKINCSFKDDKNDYTHGYLGDMVMTKDGKLLYVLDQIGFRMIVLDVVNQKILYNIPTGRYPFGITLSPDEKQVYVANVGVFEYKPFTDLNPKDLKNTAHKFPATRYNSKEMIEGEAEKGIPALGSPNAPEAFSVWKYKAPQPPKGESVNARKKESFPENQPNSTSFGGGWGEAKIKTGFLVGQMVEDFPAVGGSSPNSVIATENYVFVSNGNNDCISVIDIKRDTVIKNIMLSPDERIKKYRGIIPFGVALSPDKKRLYVAEAGINAITVIDAVKLTVLGHIPTGWFPSKLAVSKDGKKLIVANAKGYGSGPNGGKNFQLGPEGSYIGSLMKGTVSVIDIPGDEQLQKETQEVIANNFNIQPAPVKSTSVLDSIKYIVFIAKENRTYDEIFGVLKGGNGDPTISRYGKDTSFFNRKKTIEVKKATVMPNHLKLAQNFAVADNFYCDSDVSADGHRWLVNTYPNEWVETGTAAAYGGKRNLQDSSKAPGNLSFYGSAGSIYPEDYNEGGSLWDHLERHKIDFFNFGFGVEMAANYSDSTMKYIGELYTINYPLPAPLYDKTSRIFPTYNTNIPDQFRADLFFKEFNEKWMGKGRQMPQVITLMLPNDHGSSERAAAGYPFNQSYMADNDLAVGRTIEFLSRTPYWKNMAIFITEDDPQGGVDHVDAHRSVLLAISPYIKRNYVGHVHYSFGSVFKTFFDALKIPYLNQYDATATNMTDMFTDKPDFTPYNAVPVDKRIFDPQKALDPHNEKFDWKAFSESEELDRTDKMQQRSREDDELRKNLKKKKKKK
jgi:YVTN family beta-propeller protein